MINIRFLTNSILAAAIAGSFFSCTPETTVEYGKGNLTPELRARIDSITSLLEENPDDKNLFFLRGKARFQAGLYEPAELDFLKSIQLGESPAYNIPPDEYADFIGPDYEFLGHTRFEMGKSAGAYEAFTSCIRLGFDTSNMYVHRSRVRALERKFREAIVETDSSILFDSASAFAYSARGFYYDNLSEPTKALEDFNRSLSLDPSDARVWSNRGYCYLKMKNLEQAEQDLTKSLSLEPGFPGALIYRGMLYLEKENYQSAHDDFDEVLKRDESDPRIFYFRGLCRIKLEMLNEGCTDLKKAADAGDLLAPKLYRQECL